MVSVVIPLYNMATLVRRALDSALVQNLEDMDVIVVDDGSTDEGPAIVASLRDPRVRLLGQENRGVAVARNLGIEMARHELVAFLDADDEWGPGHLHDVLALQADFPNAKVYATGYVFRYPDGSLLRPRLRRFPRGPWRGVVADYFTLAARSDPPLFTSAVAAGKAALTAVRGFPPGIASGEDLLTWARLACRFQIAYTTDESVIMHRKELEFGRPVREPPPEDPVGRELEELLKRAPPSVQPGLRRYIGLWHKMRADCLLRLGRKRDAWRELRRAMMFNPLDLRLLGHMGLLALPAQGRCSAQRVVARVREAVRHRQT